MTRFPTLQILEGENLSLSLQGDDDSQFLFGDESGSNLYQLSKSLDHLRKNYYSPLYKKYVPENSGYIQVNRSLQGEDGNLYHFTLSGDFLGCSVCSFTGLLAGENITQYTHYNFDGTLAGVTIENQDGRQFLYEGGYELSGFNLGKLKIGGGFKLPNLGKLNFKVPKFNLPKLSLPKIKLPKLPNFKVPDIGKQLSKATSSISKGVSNVGKQLEKGVSNVGKQIEKGVTKHFENIGEVLETVGDVATGLLDTAGSLLGPNQGQAMEEQPAEEELTPQDPGYSDENGYTASDGVYYSHDGNYYFDFQTNQWVPLNQETGVQYSDIGYSDDNGYRASDGLFYSHDGQYVLNEQTNEWIQT